MRRAVLPYSTAAASLGGAACAASGRDAADACRCPRHRSNRNLEDLCRKGVFREDLYYRLNVVPVDLPPLPSREGDILLLANEFVTRFLQRVRPDSSAAPTIDRSAASVLMRYPWPGNVRELQNVMERAALLVDGHTVLSAHLPERLRSLVDTEALPSEGGLQAGQAASRGSLRAQFSLRIAQAQRRPYEPSRPGSRSGPQDHRTHGQKARPPGNLLRSADPAGLWVLYVWGPATTIPRSYLGDPAKWRMIGGSEIVHSHHLHGGSIRWARQPGTSKLDPTLSAACIAPEGGSTPHQCGVAAESSH